MSCFVRYPFVNEQPLECPVCFRVRSEHNQGILWQIQSPKLKKNDRVFVWTCARCMKYVDLSVVGVLAKSFDRWIVRHRK
jgi:hypothetical protein